MSDLSAECDQGGRSLTNLIYEFTPQRGANVAGIGNLHRRQPPPSKAARRVRLRHRRRLR
jgi:hypothetical protein